jgi:hypothetical protein
MVSCWVWSDGYELAESGDSLDRWELVGKYICGNSTRKNSSLKPQESKK